jgi:lipopolysaccharide transport system ATP-binding protein
MSENAIVVENLSKHYLIGHQLSPEGRYKYVALRDVIGREVRNFARKATDFARGRQVISGDEIEEFWALKDVSFSVRHGEVIGILGRNGAGKSTLLKILSRITEPTGGRIILRGRVASLLEVGTGFHPELTGRENIYLNGAILGMTQGEIRRKFDEIVGFAEVEKFLDTPVKHYSSGMYVRLAFAVAAHLEPEILVVDEVLAVGDVEFQKKCLGKMDEVSRSQGRTVLFVSHNLDAVTRLCTRGVYLSSGSVGAIGDVKTVVQAYVNNQSTSPRVVDYSTRVRTRESTAKVRLASASPTDAVSNWLFPFGQKFSLDLSVDAQSSLPQVGLGLFVYSVRGFEVASWTSTFSRVPLPVRPGINTFRIEFDNLRLLPGRYYLGIGARDDRGEVDYIHEAVMFEIVPNAESAEIDAQNLGGAVAPGATIVIVE